MGLKRAAMASAIALATQTGCALLASANASHSHISGCVGDPTFAAIDLVLGTLGAGVLVWAGTAEESPGWLAVPGVFALSGVIGSITSYSCRHPDPGSSTATAGPAPIYYVAPDPAPPAEPEPEVHLVDPPDPSPPKVRLELDPDYLREHGAAPPPKDGRVECSIEPLTACPPQQSCVLDAGTHGHCRPDR